MGQVTAPLGAGTSLPQLPFGSPIAQSRATWPSPDFDRQALRQPASGSCLQWRSSDKRPVLDSSPPCVHKHHVDAPCPTLLSERAPCQLAGRVSVHVHHSLSRGIHVRREKPLLSPWKSVTLPSRRWAVSCGMKRARPKVIDTDPDLVPDLDSGICTGTPYGRYHNADRCVG